MTEMKIPAAYTEEFEAIRVGICATRRNIANCIVEIQDIKRIIRLPAKIVLASIESTKPKSQ